MTAWTIAQQAPFSMVFPRQKYWSDLPFPPSGDLPASMLNAECEKGLSEKGIGGSHDALGKH